MIERIDAAHLACVAIGKTVEKQASILAFSDTFHMLGVTLIVAPLEGLVLKKPIASKLAARIRDSTTPNPAKARIGS